MPTWRDQQQYSDPWSFIDYKKAFGNKSGAASGWAAPFWVGDDFRRICAYVFYEDICKNQARRWLEPETTDEDREDHREYGDPGMYVLSIVSSILGDEQTVLTEGVIEERAIAPDGAGGNAVAQQEILERWMLDERFLVKMMSNEKKCVRLGDQVYVLGWDDRNSRPRLRTYDPGFYFPVLDDWAHDDDYPWKIHIAWEYERPEVEGSNRKVKVLRRITWWLEEYEDQTFNYPWNAEPSNVACWMEEREWNLSELSGYDIYDLSDDGSTIIQEEINLGIDFIPVVHIPNTAEDDEHFGISSLALALQAFDDLASTDSDLQAAAATTGSPPLGLQEGMMPPTVDGEITTYGPGQVFTGQISMPDTSRSLDALIKLKDSMQDRVSVNLRVPNTLIGRVDPSKVESGIILTLSFQPHSNMIREMRLVRRDKYSLLFKFVTRFYLLAGVLSIALPVELKFGSYLPADRTETASIVNQGITGKWMSVETAVQLLVEAGYPVDDATLEIQRIIQNDFTSAKAMLDATADIDAVRLRLGLSPLPELGFEEEEGEEEDFGGLPPAPPLPE